MSGNNYSSVCEQIKNLEEDGIIQLLEGSVNTRHVVLALLEMGYIIGNYEMTQVGEYPFLPGEKNGVPFVRLNKIMQQRNLGAYSQ